MVRRGDAAGGAGFSTSSASSRTSIRLRLRADHAAQARRIEELNASGDHRAAVKYFLSGYGLPNEALEEMLDSPAAPAMLAGARVLPYDYAMLGDGVLPVEAATHVTVPTLVVADHNEPEIARALVDVMPRATLVPAPASTHELAPDEIASLAEPFLLLS